MVAFDLFLKQAGFEAAKQFAIMDHSREYGKLFLHDGPPPWSILFIYYSHLYSHTQEETIFISYVWATIGCSPCHKKYHHVF